MLQLYLDVWQQLIIENELVKHCNERAVSTRIIVPAALRDEVFRALHEPAHHGYEASLRRITQRFWWPRVRTDVSAYVRACDVCDRDRNSNPAPRAPPGHLPANQPFATLYIDIVGGQGSLSLGASPKSILTMIDGLTGWAVAVPIDDQSAATVARAVYREWFPRFGVPDQLHSDRGAQFESALFAELCAMFGVDKTRTTPYRPQANGKCERFNRTLVSMLRRAVQKRPYNWEPLLAPVLQAYRSTVSEATGFTPFRLTFGSEMRLPVDLGTPLPEPPRSIRSLASCLAEDLEWSYKVAREVIGHNHNRAERRFNERTVEKMYDVGSLVSVVQFAHSRAVPSKLDARYSGLCEVFEVRGPTLTLRELSTRRVFTANHDAVRKSTLTKPAAAPARPQTAAPPSQGQPAAHRILELAKNPNPPTSTRPFPKTPNPPRAPPTAASPVASHRPPSLLDIYVDPPQPLATSTPRSGYQLEASQSSDTRGAQSNVRQQPHSIPPTKAQWCRRSRSSAVPLPIVAVPPIVAEEVEVCTTSTTRPANLQPHLDAIRKKSRRRVQITDTDHGPWSTGAMKTSADCTPSSSAPARVVAAVVPPDARSLSVQPKCRSPILRCSSLLAAECSESARSTRHVQFDEVAHILKFNASTKLAAMVDLSSRITVPTKNLPQSNKDINGSSECAPSIFAISSVVAAVASPRAFTPNIWSPHRLPIAGGQPPQSTNIEEIEYWKAFEEKITNDVLRPSTPSDIVATNLSNIQSKTATRVYYHYDVTARARPTVALPRSTYLPDSQLRTHWQSWHARQLTRPLAIAARVF